MLKEHALRALELQETAIAAIERETRELGWEAIAASREPLRKSSTLSAPVREIHAMLREPSAGQRMRVGVMAPTPMEPTGGRREAKNAHRRGESHLSDVLDPSKPLLGGEP